MCSGENLGCPMPGIVGWIDVGKSARVRYPGDARWEKDRVGASGDILMERLG